MLQVALHLHDDFKSHEKRAEKVDLELGSLFEGCRARIWVEIRHDTCFLRREESSVIW